MNIVGLDVGRGSAVLCCLDGFPDNVERHYKLLRKERKFITAKCDAPGVDKLLALKPNGIVLEPTGHWYAHFWVMVAKKHGIDIYWVGHTDLDTQRGSYNLPNKMDDADALCLAASYFDDRFVDNHGSKRFLNYYYHDDALITRVREVFLEKEQLQKLRTGLVAQLRQRLALEYPEAVKVSLKISPVKGYTPLIGWLAGINDDARYANKYRTSIAQSLGITISDYTRAHAKTICELELRITASLDWFRTILDHDEFLPYFRVFDRFGLGLDNKVLLLYHCYPFEKFLVDGKPWIEREMSNNGKLQKRDRSLRKFQAFLGMSYKYRQSGDKKTRSFHGSSLVRAHLYVWAVCMVAPKGDRISSNLGRLLSQRYDQLRQTVKGKDALIRILFKATRMMFYELLNELS